MSSRLKARSAPAKGSVFYFEIPICRMPSGDRCGEDLDPRGGKLSLFPQFTQRGVSSKRLGVVPRRVARLGSKRTAELGPTRLSEEERPRFNTPNQAFDWRGVDSQTKRRTAEDDKEEILREERTKAEFPPTRGAESMVVPKFRRGPSRRQLSFACNKLVQPRMEERRGSLLSPRPDTGNESSGSPQPASAMCTGEGRKVQPVVVIADDYAGNRLVLVKMLEKLRVRTVEAENGQEACKLVVKYLEDPREMPIALILMDVDMPVMDGIQATMKIRNMEERVHRATRIPIVAVTAFNSENDKQTCFEAGMQNFVPKPVQFSALKGLVATYCQLQSE